MTEPRHVGTWVVCATSTWTLMWVGVCTPSNLLPSPFPPDDKDARRRAYELWEQGTEGTLYLIHVFDNGQVEQLVFNTNDYRAEQEKTS